MQWLWNELFAIRERARVAAAEIPREDKKRRAAVWSSFEDEVEAFLNGEEVKGRLGWEAREFVADRFRTASRKAAKEHAELKQKRRLDKIIIPHRFTGGGLEVEKFWGGRRAGLQIERIAPEAYSDQRNQTRRMRRTFGRYGVDGTQFQFRAYLHRPLPEGSVVKQVAWSSLRHPTRDWQHSLLVWVEEPPPETAAREQTNQVAALDLGWRKFPEYLRVGLLYDTAGNVIEFRLPLAETSNVQTRRDELPDTYADIQRLTVEVSKLVDETKEGLRELLPGALPDEAQTLVSRMTQLRQGGLVRLLGALERDGGEELAGAVEFLRGWKDKNDRLRKRINDTRDRLLRRRDGAYRNLALWLCRTYDRVIWEGDLSLKDMAENATGDEALENAAKYRAWASLYVLRSAVKEAAAKLGAELVPGETAGTTTTCMECGRECEPTARLKIKCPVGHEADQDIQASYNLLNQIPREELPRESKACVAVAIPEHLGDYAVRLR